MPERPGKSGIVPVGVCWTYREYLEAHGTGNCLLAAIDWATGLWPVRGTVNRALTPFAGGYYVP